MTLDELIPENHLVGIIEAYFAGLNLGTLGFAEAFSKTMGRPPYDPADWLKLYLYGYLIKVRSSRGLESTYRRNVEVMCLLAGPFGTRLQDR